MVYYSRTGYTERLVNEMKLDLANKGFVVDVFRVIPIREYSKPLHINPRLIYDTLIRKGTSIKFEPSVLKLNDYNAVIVASPIWIGTMPPPIQEFLRRYSIMRSVIVTTSIRSMKTERIENIVEKISGIKPLLCVNVRDAIIKDPVKLRDTIKDFIERFKATVEGSST